MRGAITGRDVLLHPLAIVRGWGVAAYVQCLLAAFRGRSSTFLGVLYGTSSGAKWGPSR